MTAYPARLTFRFPNDPTKAGAVLQAALDLQLPFETHGPEIVVLVDAPMTAYQFGVRTQEALRRIAARTRQRQTASRRRKEAR